MVDATWPEWGVKLRIRDRASAVGLLGLGVISCIAFAGCGTDDEAPVASQSAAPVASQSEAPVASQSAAPVASQSEAPVASQSAAPVEIVGVYEAVEFYPACGNEILQHQGVTWYPVQLTGYEELDADIQPLLDEVLAVEREDSPVAGVRGLRVVAPGPGDDIGTLVVWADGVARWVSDSRDLDVWMIDDRITYYVVC